MIWICYRRRIISISEFTILPITGLYHCFLNAINEITFTVWFPVLERPNIVSVIWIIFNSLPTLLISLERTKIRGIIRKFYEATFSMFFIVNIVSFVDISILPHHSTCTMWFPCDVVPYSISTVSPKDQASSICFSIFIDLREFNSFAVIKFFHRWCSWIFKFRIAKFKFRQYRDGLSR